ncbi:MAG: resuscitation-promoting factor RpfB [Solirubrobacteraceae bacterium]|nr:resuscitation-promoting factor RpfB [Solirubrobacteraceae bacterium]
MTHNRSTDAARDPWRASLRKSRERRAATQRARQWSLRRRSVAACACAVMALGGGVAVAGNGGTATSTESAAAPTTSLKPGSSGTAVKTLQRKLGVKATGFYGKLTKAAVKRFQRRSGLNADGIAGAATLSRLGIRLEPTDAGADTGGGSNANVPAVLQRIAQCESGGNPRAVSADGRYHGKYQFDLPTWRAVGGSGSPADAPESVQDRLAVKLYNQRGTAPWGRCANA